MVKSALGWLDNISSYLFHISIPFGAADILRAGDSRRVVRFFRASQIGEADLAIHPWTFVSGPAQPLGTFKKGLLSTDNKPLTSIDIFVFSTPNVPGDTNLLAYIQTIRIKTGIRPDNSFYSSSKTISDGI
jgi:hypothetical protein